MTKSLRESRPLTLAEAGTGTNGNIPVVLIDVGWGSSGYYSESVLKNAAKAGVFSEGLQMYLDHPGENESYDRPERSVRDLVATLATPGTYNEASKGIVSEAKPMGANAVMLQDKEFLGAIGLSIRAYGDSTIGEAEGRKGQIITELTEAISVDFVTKAGRGGRVLVDLMESARPEQVVGRAIKHGVTEATAEETRTALQDKLTSTYGAEKSWAWVRDFDETNVWFQYETPDGAGTYQDSYALDTDGNVTLGGSPVEVRAQTQYVPVKATPSESANPQLSAPAEKSTAKERNMANVEIEETELSRLRDSDAQRVQAESRAAEAELRLAQREARDAGVRIISTESVKQGVTFSPLEMEGLLAQVILGEKGIDEAGFTVIVEKEIKAKLESGQSGNVFGIKGFGASADTSAEDAKALVAEAESKAASAFGRTVKGA